MFRSKLATVPGKLAFAAAGLTLATTGLAAANALPTPAQQAAATLADVVGLDVPAPGDTTALPVDGTTIPPVDGTTIPPVDGTTIPPVDGTTIPPADGTTIPSPGGISALSPPATSAQQAAHIHDFDAACGNHGQYVSYVARNGTEPACATSVRNGSAATPPTTTGSTPTQPDPGAAPSEAGRTGKPLQAPKPAKGSSATKGHAKG